MFTTTKIGERILDELLKNGYGKGGVGGRLGGEGKGIEKKIFNSRRGLLKISNRVNISSLITRWDPVLENSIKGSFIHSCNCVRN